MDDRSVERLYREHANGLFAFLAYRTGDRALAEDLLADAFERVMRARKSFDRSRGSERTWLYGIALNVLRDHARRSRIGESALTAVAASAPASAPASDDALESRDAVMRALEALSPEEREAIALRFGADLTVPEIAKVTGQPLDRAEGRVYRAMRKLKPLLAEDDS